LLALHPNNGQQEKKLSINAELFINSKIKKQITHKNKNINNINYTKPAIPKTKFLREANVLLLCI